MSFRSLSSAEACSLPADEVLRALQVDPRHGLSALDVAARRRAHGPNELETKEKESIWAKFLEKAREPMIALLLGSAGISLLTGQ
jgi:P-type Ca2+ transporter type 2C